MAQRAAGFIPSGNVVKDFHVALSLRERIANPYPLGHFDTRVVGVEFQPHESQCGDAADDVLHVLDLVDAERATQQCERESTCYALGQSKMNEVIAFATAIQNYGTDTFTIQCYFFHEGRGDADVFAPVDGSWVRFRLDEEGIAIRVMLRNEQNPTRINPLPNG